MSGVNLIAARCLQSAQDAERMPLGVAAMLARRPHADRAAQAAGAALDQLGPQASMVTDVPPADPRSGR